MSLTNLVLADGQSTPVDHTFSWDTEHPVAAYSDKVGGVSIGFPRVTLGRSLPSRNRRSYKTTIRVEVPVLEAISGDVGGYTAQPKVAFTMLFEGHFTSPDRSASANRADLYAYVSNLLTQAMVKTMVVDQLPAV